MTDWRPPAQLGRSPLSTFTLTSGRLAIGDPTMGMVVIDYAPTGEFGLRPGSLVRNAEASPRISLDSPALFVVDAERLKEFEAWYHRVGGETSYNLMLIEGRIDEDVAGNVLGWEQDGKRLVGYWIGREHWGKGAVNV